MKAVNLNGTLTAVEDTESNLPSGASVLTSPVTINKSGSANLGKQAEIVNVRNNKVVVQYSGEDKFGTYNFDQLN